MTLVMILLAGWFMLAQNRVAKQNIAVMFAVAYMLGIVLWIF